MSARTVDGVNVTGILERVGLDEQTLDDMCRIMAQANIRDYLHTKAMRIAVTEYIKALSYNAKIKGFELDNI